MYRNAAPESKAGPPGQVGLLRATSEGCNMRWFLLLMLLINFATSSAAQSLVFNGDFEAGGPSSKPGWRFVTHVDSDPNGKHGFRSAPVKAGKPDDCLYTYFGKDDQWHFWKLAAYNSQPFFAEAKKYDVAFNYMWEKTYSFLPIGPISHPISLSVLDASSKTVVTSIHVFMRTNAIIERGTHLGKLAFPRAGSYFIDVHMGCYPLRGNRYFAHIDDIVIGKKGALLTGQLSAPKRMDLALESPGDAGLTYALASSLGTGPIPIGNRVLGLSPDPLFSATAQNFLPGIFQQYRGKLDSKGKASATIAYPKDKWLIGLKIHSAFVVLHHLAQFGVMSISNTYSFSIM
jgi:hypothetical protein